jgi:hypothetical protein
MGGPFLRSVYKKEHSAGGGKFMKIGSNVIKGPTPRDYAMGPAASFGRKKTFKKQTRNVAGR